MVEYTCVCTQGVRPTHEYNLLRQWWQPDRNTGKQQNNVFVDEIVRWEIVAHFVLDCSASELKHAQDPQDHFTSLKNFIFSL